MAKNNDKNNDKYIRCRLIGLVSYLDIETIQHKCILCGCLYYAFILHDKDIYTENIYDSEGVLIHNKGDLKKTHVHIFLEFENQKSLKVIAKLFCVADNLVECIDSKKGYLTYFTHKEKNELGCYIYNDSDIITNIYDIDKYTNNVGDITIDAFKSLNNFIVNYRLSKNCFPNLSNCINYLIDNGFTYFAFKYHSLIKNILLDYISCKNIDLLINSPMDYDNRRIERIERKS